MTLPDQGSLSHDSLLRLLLIEDSASDSELVMALLEDELPHARVHVVANLEDALVALSSQHYDATLADLSLPDADGLAVVRAVRATHPDVALLVLTGRADGGLALWALAEGAQDYLVKGQHDGPRLATALLHALQRQRAEQEAHRYLQLARGLLDALEAPTCAVGGDTRIVAVNEAWRSFAAANDGDPQACGEGVSYLGVCGGVAPGTADHQDALEVADGLRDVLAGRRLRYECTYPCHSLTRERWFSVRISPVVIDDGPGAVISHVDITAMHEVQEALAHQALHDALTGLPNRSLLVDRLTQAMADGDRRDLLVGVGFLDVDGFKRINDRHGHDAGDAVLEQIAGRLAALQRVGDTLARYSGDEFVMVWRDLACAEDAATLADRVTESLRPPFRLGGIDIEVAASLGVAVGRTPTTAEALLLSADSAMYDAKRHGGGRVRHSTPETRRGDQDRRTSEARLQTALDRSELVLHYQPVIELATGRTVAVEALARWQHPDHGLVGPGGFIRLAEETGLILPVGRWALHRACHDAVAFGGAARGLDVAVNVSARQLIQPDVLVHVREALAGSGLDPHRLILEVTESAIVQDEDAAALALEVLVGLGVRIAIDDFGTGYSSLLYLRRYPISGLKLDREFVSGLESTADDAAICRSVVSLASAVGATSIAEGVETQAQYAALLGMGCQQAQGFLWSPGVPAAELARVVATCALVPVPVVRRRRPASAGEQTDPVLRQRIHVLHDSGASLLTIAATLNRAKAPNPTGLRWTAAAVARHLGA